MSTATTQRPLTRVRPHVSRPQTSSRPRRRETLRRDLQASVADGTFFGVMVGCGETYLAAFVLAVGLGEVTAGLIASVPLLAGGVVQLVTPRAVQSLGSHRRWVVLCAAVQAASFLPLVAAALWGDISPAVALLVAAVYWGTGMATGPAWNTWIGTLVPRRIRSRYFARRTRISQAAVLAGFLAGGLALQAGTAWDRPLWAFAALFLLASACRLLSAWHLARHSEPLPPPVASRREPARALSKRLSLGPSGRLLRYVILMQAAVQISGPYFASYMLGRLQLSYSQFVLLIGTAFVAKIVTLPLFGHFAHRFGARRLLWVGGVGIVPGAALWLVSDSLVWLTAVQVLSGAMWAAYELAIILLFFESIPEDERTRVLTLYNLANSAALVGGSLVGGAVLHHLGATHAAYGVLFAASSTLRALTVFLLARVPEVSVDVVPVGLRTLAMRPTSGGLDRPILSSLPDHAAEPQPATAGGAA